MYSFKLAENKTTFAREILAGCVTFAAMAYILCVQPAVMSGSMFGQSTGMDEGALITATCIVCAIGCIAMGLYTRYPFAMAPGMGTNFFVVLGVFPACAAILGLDPKSADPAIWQLGMGVVFAAGLLFFILSLCRVREQIVTMVSHSMKMAVCAGIGLFLAYLGMVNATLIEVSDGALQLGHLMTPGIAIFLTGFLVSSVLMVRNIPGSILLGIIAASIVAYCVGELHIDKVVGMPADPMQIVGKMDVSGTFAHFWKLLPFIFILTFMDVFDAFGTFIGLGYLGNFFQEDGQLPRIKQLFLADATITMFGAYCGHSTMTTYLESSAGIESGGRTGLTAVTVGVLFLLSLFFWPIIMAVGGCLPITASALILVGILMTLSVQEIDWSDMTEVIPAFLIIVGIPFLNSISNGIICGVVVYPILKICAGRWKEVKPGMYVLAILLASLAISQDLSRSDGPGENPEAAVESTSVMEETPAAPILTDDAQKN